MKRLAWLLLAVFCSALARVQPVEWEQHCKCVCCHCKAPGTCGMPCSRAPAQEPTSLLFAAGRTAGIAKPSRRQVPLAPPSTEKKFYAAYVEPTTASVAISRLAPPAPPANVPLFTAHCSFLI